MFKEKVAVVTGGASGIGLATTKKLLSEGANVVILDLKMDEEIINSLGGNAIYLKCDVSNEENVKNCIEEIIKKFNHIDYLVANAGIGGSASKPHEVSMDEWNKVISVNQTGIFLLNKYVINEMLKNGKGAVVNTSSMYGLVGSTTSFAYSASKGAINQMTRSLALTYARDNIRVNAIAPGYMATNNTAQLRSDSDRSEAIIDRIPAGRWGTPDDMKGAVVFLASAASDYVNGFTLAVDGGWLAR